MIQPEYIGREFYEERTHDHEQRLKRHARQSLRVSNLRGLTFVVFAVAAGFGAFGRGGVAAWSLAVIGLAFFVSLVVKHARIIQAEALEERWVRVNRDAASRVTPGGWHSLPQTGESFRDPEHAYSEDLDIFGKASLFQRLSVAQTHMGQSILAAWLTTPAEPDEILDRQRTIAALAPKLDLRQQLEVLGIATREVSRRDNALRDPKDLEPFLSWAEAHRQNDTHKYAAVAWGLPCTTALCALLAAFGYAPVSIVLIPVLLSLWALGKARSQMSTLLEVLQTAERTVTSAGTLFRLLEKNAKEFGLSNTLAEASVGPSEALARLSRIGDWFEIRHNGLIYPFIDVLVLFDIHCWLRFERWRAQYGHWVRGWFAAIGRAEALSSLAGFGYDEPGSTFAEFGEHTGVEAIDLGHPLIAPAYRVTNDLPALKPGCGLLVTGSNMSGKSTYLRAMGLGCVLGLAGAYVPAKRLRLCHLQIATSMRIRDDLSGGVSHFYAELQKLRRVLDMTTRPLPVLFLLDEILHGTNSRERQIGARFVIAELLRAGALGAVSTHDEALCELSGELAQRLRLVHFRESMTDGNMTFDYQLHGGAVTSGNALRLMQKMGIPVPLQAE